MVNSQYGELPEQLPSYPHAIIFAPMAYIPPVNSYDISYDEEKYALVGGGRRTYLSSGSLEHYFCKSMFRREPGELVSWDEIADEMDCYLTRVKDALTVKQTIKDVKRRINAKIAQTFGAKDYFRSKNSEYLRQ